MDYLEVKKCEVCGKTKHISEFSKSYPNRCKTCVAEHTRQMRAAEKLKAKVKATGEVIDVEPSGTMLVSCGSFITKDGRKIPGTALEFEKAIDWEQRRYEIAKELMKGFSANSHNQCVDASSETLAQWSINSIFKQWTSDTSVGYTCAKRILEIPAHSTVRNDDGFPDWSHRVGSIGNAVNPTVAKYLFECIKIFDKQLA